ncbi:MAG: VanZ family protein [Bacteroidales bacterium]|nr:VanZ family protein [Bacteroidales bacterium]
MFNKYNLPSLIWALIIFVFSAIPGDDIPSFDFLKNIPADKIVHFGLYGVFNFLLVFGFKRQYTSNRLRYKSYTYSFVTAALYGGMLEIFQKYFFTGRTSDIMDFMANVAGCLSGILVYWFLSKNRLFYLKKKF